MEVVYRHYHHGNGINEFNNQLEAVISKITLENKLFYLTGDLTNINILKDNETYIDDFIDMMYSYSLSPLILRPTRITDKSETLIDNIFTNDFIDKTSGILISDTSDHFPNFTISRININSNKSNKPTKVRDFSDNNILNVKIHMAKIYWQDLLKLFDNASHDKFIEIFTDLLDKYTPLKRKRKRNLKPNLVYLG